MGNGSCLHGDPSPRWPLSRSSPASPRSTERSLPDLGEATNCRELAGAADTALGGQVLHVLLRDRLLLQPHGFEGFGLATEGVPPDGLPVTPLADNPEPLLDWRGACRAVSAIAHYRDGQVTRVAHFNDLDGEVGQVLEKALPPSADTGVAVIVALHRGQRRNAFHILVHQCQEGGQVTSIEGVNASVSQFHVLLRNTRSPARKLRVFIRRG